VQPKYINDIIQNLIENEHISSQEMHTTYDIIIFNNSLNFVIFDESNLQNSLDYLKNLFNLINTLGYMFISNHTEDYLISNCDFINNECLNYISTVTNSTNLILETFKDEIDIIYDMSYKLYRITLIRKN
jgi:hypothetical protein